MRAIFLLPAALTLTMMCPAQDVLSGSEPGSHPLLFNADAVVLEAGEPRKDLGCTVTPLKPSLGFDLKFHSGYTVSIPLRELEGPGNLLSVLFRVSAKDHKDDAVYFKQQIRVPPIDQKAAGDVKLEGSFDAGEGSYHVDWLMRDTAGRFCSFYWDVEAALLPRDKRLTVALAPDTIRPAEDEHFQNEPPVHRTPNEPLLDVKVLMNFAPQKPYQAALDPVDTLALVSILRSIARNPRIGKFSLVAFNIQEQREFYRQEYADHIDFPALGQALKKLNLGTVDRNRLARKNGDAEFLSTLIRTEISAGDSHPDGLIFVSPKTLIDSSVPQGDLKEAGDLEYPVFYMNFNLDPQGVPWRDAIGRMVKFFKGREFTISGPRDLWNAVTETVSRIAKFKQGQAASALQH